MKFCSDTWQWFDLILKTYIDMNAEVIRLGVWLFSACTYLEADQLQIRVQMGLSVDELSGDSGPQLKSPLSGPGLRGSRNMRTVPAHVAFAPAPPPLVHFPRSTVQSHAIGTLQQPARKSPPRPLNA